MIFYWVKEVCEQVTKALDSPSEQKIFMVVIQIYEDAMNGQLFSYLVMGSD